MNLPETRDSQAVDYGEAGPTAVRMLLGARLRKLREAAGVSREDAGYAIRSSESKISLLELGRTGCKLRDVSDLLDLYRVSEGERATLLAMAGSANAPGWWQQYGDAVPDWFEPYLGLEQAAEVIRCYEVQFVPGLLQTPGYARAVFQIEAGNDPGLDTEQQVSVRIRRQQVLHRPGPPRLWAVIDEAALRRPIGAPLWRAPSLSTSSRWPGSAMSAFRSRRSALAAGRSQAALSPCSASAKPNCPTWCTWNGTPPQCTWASPPTGCTTGTP